MPLSGFTLALPLLSAELLSWVLICLYNIFPMSGVLACLVPFLTHSAHRGRTLLFLLITIS